jgi:hypothetical protein
LSFNFNFDGMLAASRELRERGWIDVVSDEEITGDDLWHMAASGRRVFADESIAALRAEMEDLAGRHGGVYDGWDLAASRGLRFAKPGELPP